MKLWNYLKNPCSWGKHDWKIIRLGHCKVWCRNTLGFDTPIRIPAEVRVEECKNCHTKRGVVDSGTDHTYLDADYIARQLNSSLLR